LIEGHAAADYWRVFRDVGLRERKGGNLPRSWMRFPPRSAGRPAFHEGVGEASSKSSPQHASHPINAMLNYANVVEAGRLARALTARGLILPLGFLHKPKRGRNSLVWDAIEPIRPAIDARVFRFAAEHEFARSDFPQAGLNVFRLSRELTQLMLHAVILQRAVVDNAADWIAKLIARVGEESTK
jgi:CRISP-associated protein Cas1